VETFLFLVLQINNFRFRTPLNHEISGRSGPMSRRKIASPPTEIASKEAPWKESHIEIVLNRPVAARASFKAMPIAVVPPGANKTCFKLPGASSASFCANRIAGKLV